MVCLAETGNGMIGACRGLNQSPPPSEPATSGGKVDWRWGCVLMWVSLGGIWEKEGGSHRGLNLAPLPGSGPWAYLAETGPWANVIGGGGYEIVVVGDVCETKRCLGKGG